MCKVAVVIGHHRLAKGANSPYLGTEWDVMKKVSDGLNCDVFIHNPNIRGYTARQKAMAKRTKGYEYVFELHFNAATPQANGCEALYWFSNKKGKEISNRFCNMCEDVFNYTNRGAKPLHSKNQRGYGFLAFTHGTAVILEPFFGSNQKDSLRFDYEKYTNLLNDLISTL